MKIPNHSHVRMWIIVLIGLLCTQIQHAQTGSPVKVQGKILDTNQVEITGAVVKIQNRAVGTATDIDGEFTLEANIGETLEISYIGYIKQYIKVTASQRPLRIILEEDSIELENVVVVGYGTTRKEKLTGAIATVSTDDFKNRPLNDVSLALQGKVAGIQVTQNSGKPGEDGGNIIVRGVGTFNDSSPLVIIDGFESSFDKVDPKDIESMTVLKDAASAAIYGNKAANGVILITTKKGRSGQLNMEYNGYLAIQKVSRYPKLLGSVDYMELHNEASDNSGKQRSFSEEWIDNFRRGDDLANYPDRNWADFYFKPAVQQNHYLKMTGGTDQLAYTLSLGYMDQSGIMEGTGYERFNFRSNTSSSFFKDKVKISTNIAGYVGNKTDLPYGTENTLARIVQMNPMVNAKMEGYGWTSWFTNDALREAGGEKTTDTKNFNGNINLTIQPISQLKIEAAISYDRTTQLGMVYAPNITIYSVETGLNGEQTIGKNNTFESEIEQSTYNYGSLSSYATINYWINVKEDHHFKVLAGAQQGKWDDKYYRTLRKRLTTNIPSLEAGDPSTQKNYNWGSETTSLSLFGRFSYDFKDKYLFEANIRHDGSSKFAPGQKWGTFPSFSAGWRIGEESFIRNNFTWINELKVRASWGQLGNEKLWSAYAGIDILAVGNSNYIWNQQYYTGSATSYIANKNLTWETTTQKNVGLDIILFKTLSLTADFYIKETDNILMQLPVSSTFGFTEDPWTNAGKMRNVGYELTASYSREVIKGLELNGSASLSYNKNKVLDLKGQSPILNNNKGIIQVEGLPINTLYGYEIEGIYQSEEEIREHLQTFDRDGNPVHSYSGLIAAPGDIRFKDQNGDGIIDLDNDRVALGNPNPDYLFSFSLGGRYKGFDLTAFFQGVIGGKGWSMGELVSPFFNGGYNAADWVLNRWTPENPNNTYQRVYHDSQRASIRSAYYLEDLSYLRLKNIELGYTVPAHIMKKIKLSGARIFVSGQNIFTLTKFKGFDPETAGLASTKIYDYPLLKTFTTGLNVTF